MSGNKQRRMCCLASRDGWYASWLTKDRGALPYLFQEYYGFEAYMAGPARPGEDYEAVISRYVPGLKMDFLPDNRLETWAVYMEGRARDFDLLVLQSMRVMYLPLADIYKRCNPEGRIYFATDMNSEFLDRINWQNGQFLRFLGQCDVIGASCRSLQRRIGQKWPCRVSYLPNGFYSYGVELGQVDYGAKNNVIMTAARLGNWQKNDELLVEAFARLAGELPEWRLRLVGTAEPAFLAWLDRLLGERQELRGRIEVGPIFDRQELYRAYREAKVFALTSRLEGGTPNVLAEALAGGCAIVCSDIDAAEDATAGGACGEVFPSEDCDALTELLRSLCRDEVRLQAYGRQAEAWCRQNFDFRQIARRLHYLLYGRRGGSGDV